MWVAFSLSLSLSVSSSCSLLFSLSPLHTHYQQALILSSFLSPTPWLLATRSHLLFFLTPSSLPSDFIFLYHLPCALYRPPPPTLSPPSFPPHKPTTPSPSSNSSPQFIFFSLLISFEPTTIHPPLSFLLRQHHTSTPYLPFLPSSPSNPYLCFFKPTIIHPPPISSSDFKSPNPLTYSFSRPPSPTSSLPLSPPPGPITPHCPQARSHNFLNFPLNLSNLSLWGWV